KSRLRSGYDSAASSCVFGLVCSWRRSDRARWKSIAERANGAPFHYRRDGVGGNCSVVSIFPIVDDLFVLSEFALENAVDIELHVFVLVVNDVDPTFDPIGVGLKIADAADYADFSSAGGISAHHAKSRAIRAAEDLEQRFVVEWRKER